MIYIATNKDNKDALMHYGVKGMKWGKRGGSFKWPWEKDDKQKNAYGTGRTVISNTIKTSRFYDPKHPRDTNIYTSQRHNLPSPKENNISTSKKTSSAPSKRTKEYFNRQLDRRRAEEKQAELRRRQDAEQTRREQQATRQESIEGNRSWNSIRRLGPWAQNYTKKQQQEYREKYGGKKQHRRSYAWYADPQYDGRSHAYRKR